MGGYRERPLKESFRRPTSLGRYCRWQGHTGRCSSFYEFINQALEESILCYEMFLDLDRFVQNRFGVVVGFDRTFVGRLARDFLSDNDDRQQHQLQKGLRDPCDERCGSTLVGVGKTDQRQCGENVGAPHAANRIGDLDGKKRVEPGYQARRFRLDGCGCIFLAMGDVRMRDVGEDRTKHRVWVMGRDATPADWAVSTVYSHFRAAFWTS